MRKHEHEEVSTLRREGHSWDWIAGYTPFGKTGNALRKAHKRYLNRQKVLDTQIPPERENEFEETVTVAGSRFPSKPNVDNLAEFFDVDLDVWEVKSFKVKRSEWDQSVREGTVAQSVQITAHFVRKKSVEVDDAMIALATAVEDMKIHSPATYGLINRRSGLGDGDEGYLFELALHDPHFGMLAWGREVGGVSQDLKIITREYGDAIDRLLQYAVLYNTDRILYILGHDMQHVNQTGMNKKGGTTAGGTAQDLDGRIAKIFTTIRRAAVTGIDKARLIAPVDVMVVPGNHDPDESYKLGEVISAWYRNDPEVNVIYSPNKRKFYGYGRNVFMMTHGEEYKRQRDNLPLIFASECPPELWVAGDRCREIHTGHSHINMEGGYYPTAEVNETQAIRTRSLPGFTATDSWHHEQGYMHRRSATALIYRKSGGIAGLHEFNL